MDVKDELLLSILVMTTPRRYKTFFPALVDELLSQIGDEPVELLGLLDNKRRTVGAKRNALLEAAAGRFFAFVDDDDRVSSDYVSSLLEAIRANRDVDVIVFDSEVCVNGAKPKRCRYGLDLEYVETSRLWTGKPAHTMCWNRFIVCQAEFPDSMFGEDVDWVRQACKRARTQARIEKTLYFYDFNSTVSETRG